MVEVEEADWDHMMRVNVTSMMLTSKHAIPAMAAGGGGAIVNISSISALRPRGLTPYTVSKGAVIALTRAMAVDHAAQGIRVNCIAPGPVYTPMVYAAGMSAGAPRPAPPGLAPRHRGHRLGHRHAALFLASDEARYITGVVLPVDGGVTLTSASAVEGPLTLPSPPEGGEGGRGGRGGTGGRREEARLDARGHPARHPSRHSGDGIEGGGVAGPVLQDQAPVHVVQQAVDMIADQKTSSR